MAVSVAIIFHLIGFIGIVFFDADFFVKTTPLNLLLMLMLLIYSQPGKNRAFVIFILSCFVVGMLVEIIGTNTGLLFGEYSYGAVLGPMIAGVPLIIGINWFIIIYCSGHFMQTILDTVAKYNRDIDSGTISRVKVWSLIIDGACIAVAFDWLMEPVAIKLGYWKWAGDGTVPFYNYVCWFFVSILLLFIFRKLALEKRNKFAVHLLLIQTMFFLLLRTFL